jgi:hypothetical protein
LKLVIAAARTAAMTAAFKPKVDHAIATQLLRCNAA